MHLQQQKHMLCQACLLLPPRHTPAWQSLLASVLCAMDPVRFLCSWILHMLLAQHKEWLMPQFRVAQGSSSTAAALCSMLTARVLCILTVLAQGHSQRSTLATDRL